jgi:hypothetical protein
VFPAAEYPQIGQPDMKCLSCPVKPHLGQWTEAKKRPHRGQLFASLPTSTPQLSQKNRGFFIVALSLLCHGCRPCGFNF